MWWKQDLGTSQGVLSLCLASSHYHTPISKAVPQIIKETLFWSTLQLKNKGTGVK